MTNTSKVSTIFILITIFLIALLDYQLAKLCQRLLLLFLPNISYIWSLSIPWLLIGIIPVFAIKSNVFAFNYNLIQKHVKEILVYTLLIIVGLIIFVEFGITHYFHSVKNPIIFFVITPIVEELIFRGWMYDVSKKITKLSPVLITAILFGLHHWQYFNYKLTDFAIFQITYTFILGLLLGKLRQRSDALYIPILLHILINYLSYRL